MPLLPIAARNGDDSPYFTATAPYYTPEPFPTPTIHRALGAESTSTSSTQQHGPTSTFVLPPAATESHGPGPNDNNGSPWGNMAAGPKSAVVLITCLAMLAIMIGSVWFCCGCCGLRQRRREARNLAHRGKNLRHLDLGDLQETERRNGGVPMSTAPNAGQHFVVGNVGLRGGQGSVSANGSTTASTMGEHTDTDAAPPSHDSVVPLYRQMNIHPNNHGISPLHSRSEEEEGVISDGKTPLSTLSLEDVVLDTRMNAGGSSRDFERRHHGARIGNTTGHTNS